MHTTEVVIPIIENDANDVKRIKLLLELPQFWQEAIGNSEWLNCYRIRVEWVEAEIAERTNKVDKHKALIKCLELGAPLIILDVGLSKPEEDYIRDRVGIINTREEQERLWQSEELSNAGGWWVLREITRLRQLGLSTPAVAISTQFTRTTRRNPLEGDVNWPSFLLRQGANFVYAKPMQEEAAKNILSVVACILSGSAPISLATQMTALYYASQEKELKLWHNLQRLTINHLDGVMESAGISGQRGKAERLGVAYNTYRNWIEKDDYL